VAIVVMVVAKTSIVVMVAKTSIAIVVMVAIAIAVMGLCDSYE